MNKLFFIGMSAPNDLHGMLAAPPLLFWLPTIAREDFPHEPVSDRVDALRFATEYELKSQGLCETTSTERFAYPDCKCGTYPENLGPCKTWEAGGAGRCAYCDHGLKFHEAITMQEKE